jgi:hypothetical protein
MVNSMIFAGMALLASILRGQAISPVDNYGSPLRRNTQITCENRMLRDLSAKEVVKGPEYEMFLKVVAAFGRDRPPRLYVIPGEGNAAYLAGSVGDGKGKILVSQVFAGLMGHTQAFTGIMAHEMAHLVLDIQNVSSCEEWIFRNPEIERAADALAARKVGFNPVRAFLIRIEELTGAKGELVSRLQALEKIEMQGGR